MNRQTFTDRRAHHNTLPGEVTIIPVTTLSIWSHWKSAIFHHSFLHEQWTSVYHLSLTMSQTAKRLSSGEMIIKRHLKPFDTGGGGINHRVLTIALFSLGLRCNTYHVDIVFLRKMRHLWKIIQNGKVHNFHEFVIFLLATLMTYLHWHLFSAADSWVPAESTRVSSVSMLDLQEGRLSDSLHQPAKTIPQAVSVKVTTECDSGLICQLFLTKKEAKYRPRKGADSHCCVTLTLDMVKVISAYTIHIGLPAYLTMWLHHVSYKSPISAAAEMGDSLATIGMGRKRGGAAVGGWVPTGSPSNTMLPGPRPTSLTSGSDPTVWPQL